MPSFNARIYSPRWGHDDTYSFEFDREHLIISMAPRRATCNWRENQDPEWVGESLQRILNNDMIYPPAVFTGMLEYLWRSWRNGEIQDADLNTELQEAINWLNTITRAKPRTDFWRGYF